MSLEYNLMQEVTSFSGYIVNNFHVHTRIMKSISNHKIVKYWWKENLTITLLNFFSVLIDIIDLCYIVGYQVVSLKYHWFDVDSIERRIIIDDYGFIMINLLRTLREGRTNPFVLSSHVKQVYYIKNNNDSIYCCTEWASRFL